MKCRCGNETGLLHRCPRVTWKATPITEINVGDTLVVMDAIICENGQHKRTVTVIRETATGRTLSFDNGTRDFYRRTVKVCKGLKF